MKRISFFLGIFAPKINKAKAQRGTEKMHLKKISLFNYKNFSEANFDFDHKINCFVGKNGVGKTNVLDAIYHLAYGKSYFNPMAVQNIKHGEEFFVLDGEFEKNQRTEQIVCSLKKGQKKVLKRNAKVYDKFSEHVGFIPLVIISPSDRDLIVEGSDERRKFLDSIISQSDSSYLHFLIQYQRILAQRNALLKYFYQNQVFDAPSISIYNLQLEEIGQLIHQKRLQFVDEFIPIFVKHHQEITDGEEIVHLKYHSQLHEKSFAQLLQESINKDRILQYTSCGIHKDDLLFEMQGMAIKKIGSQGQQKSLLIALKLAQFEFLKKNSGVKPLLLLDDIFDKLDEFRVGKIVEMVNNDSFGQLFISDTHADRTEDIIRNTHQSYKIFNL